MTHRLPSTLSRRLLICAAAGWFVARAMNQGSSRSVHAAGIASTAEVVRRGADFLLRAQAADGGWKSAVYGQLKGGAALTTLVLEALSRLPQPTAEDRAASERGFAFLSAGWAKRKTIAAPDGSLDFPTYGAALWLQARRRLNVPTAALDSQATDFLLAAQCGPARGFEAAHPAVGGWDFLSAEDARGVTTGTNLSVTRHVLEALEPTKTEAANHARKAALDWLARCQQRDGGFAFTPEPGSLNNKAEYSDEALLQPRSYGPPTCDGVRALLACGVQPSDARVTRATAWLAERKRLDVVPGFEQLPPERGWQRGLRFYYYAALAGLWPLLPDPERSRRREALADLLAREQLSTGAWVSDSDRMRENDPLIATSLALAALAAA